MNIDKENQTKPMVEENKEGIDPGLLKSEVENANENKINMEEKNFGTTSQIKGTEEIIYQTPQDIPQNEGFESLQIMMLVLALKFISMMLVGVCLVVAYNTTPINLKPLFIFEMCAQVFFGIFSIYLAVRLRNMQPDMTSFFIHDVILSISFFLIFLAFYLVFVGSLQASYLPFFTIPHLVICIVRFSIPTPPGALPNFDLLTFIHGIQLVIISFKLGGTEPTNWTLNLILVYIVAFLLLFLGGIIVIFLFILIFLFLNVQALANLPVAAKLLILFFATYILGFIVVYYLIVSGLDNMLSAGQIFSRGSGGSPDHRLYAAGIILIVINVLAFIAVVIGYYLLKNLIQQIYAQAHSKEISMKTFDTLMSVNAKQVSDNYYRPMGSKDVANKDEKVNQDNAPKECTICCDKPPNTLFKPCGHGGVCEDCIRENLKKSENCLFCKERIDEVLLLVPDPEHKTFKAKGVIKMKR